MALRLDMEQGVHETHLGQTLPTFGLLRIGHSCLLDQISFCFVNGNYLEDCNQNDTERVSFNKVFNLNFNYNLGNFILLFCFQCHCSWKISSVPSFLTAVAKLKNERGKR